MIATMWFKPFSTTWSEVITAMSKNVRNHLLSYTELLLMDALTERAGHLQSGAYDKDIMADMTS